METDPLNLSEKQPSISDKPRRRRPKASALVARRLYELGYSLNERDFRVIRGNKRISDVLECWNITVWDERLLQEVEISSTHTMTELAKTDLTVHPGRSCEATIYGDWLAIPRPKLPPNMRAKFFTEILRDRQDQEHLIASWLADVVAESVLAAGSVYGYNGKPAIFKLGVGGGTPIIHDTTMKSEHKAIDYIRDHHYPWEPPIAVPFEDNHTFKHDYVVGGWCPD